MCFREVVFLIWLLLNLKAEQMITSRIQGIYGCAYFFAISQTGIFQQPGALLLQPGLRHQFLVFVSIIHEL